MKNISFDNPYLLLIIIPLLALILIPIFIAIRKENNSKSVVASTIIHIVLALCITLALGGMIYTSVMTETQVYVLADVSYSADRNLDQVDEYIKEIESNLPRNAKMSVIVFAKEYKVLTQMGESFTTVKDHGFKPLEVAATDISTVISDTVEMFDEDVIKRIIVITDGKQTHTSGSSEMVAAVEKAYSQNVNVDAIYVDNNLTDQVPEVQISQVEFAPSTYKNHPTSARILIQSTYDTDNAIIDFFVDSVRTGTLSVSLNKGFNVINYDLPTGSAGSYDYRFIIRAEEDTATANNVYDFTQTVTNNLNVLLVSWDEADVERVKDFYDEETVIDAYIQQPKVPCTVEEICKYDEIILSNFDVRDIENYTSFVNAIDKVVSRFGKSLMTMGDLRIQNREDTVLKQLEDMLPIRYGNSDQEPKLYAIVLDCSRSMQNFSRLRIAKQAAIQLMAMLNDNDYVMVVAFWGDVKVLQAPTKATNREDVAQLIRDFDPKQGTMLGTALDKAGEQMIELAFDEKQIMLISDGMSHSMESDKPEDVVAELKQHGIVTSVIHPAGVENDTSEVPNGNPEGLKKIAKAGGGQYFLVTRESDLLNVMFSQIAPGLTDSVVEGKTEVKIALSSSDLVADVESLPNIYGYTYAKAKASASTVLTVNYVKANDRVVEAPLFAHWNYGHGRVSSFTSTLTGEWAKDWNSENATRFFSNAATASTPLERLDTPYEVNVTFDGAFSQVEIVPVTLRSKASCVVTITTPDNEELVQTLAFDSSRYFYSFETPKTGRYQIHVAYTYDGTVFESNHVFNISYSPEYNMFEVFDPASLHAAIRNRGTVYEGTIPSLENDEKELSTYTVRFLAPLMILSAVLYVVDIIIRKLKISDIKSFFGIKSNRGGGK